MARNKVNPSQGCRSNKWASKESLIEQVENSEWRFSNERDETGMINGVRPGMEAERDPQAAPGRDGERGKGFAESAAAVEISLAFGQGGGAEAEQPFSVGDHATPPSPCPSK